MNLKIALIDSKQITIDDLSAAFKGASTVEVIRVDRAFYAASPPPGLDAIFLILPAAERWGAKPLPGRCQVLPTTSDDQKNGMPPYVVTGIVLRPEDIRGAIAETRLLVTAAFEAVFQHNALNHRKINRLGFWAFDLLRGVSSRELKEIFKEAEGIS